MNIEGISSDTNVSGISECDQSVIIDKHIDFINKLSNTLLFTGACCSVFVIISFLIK